MSVNPPPNPNINTFNNEYWTTTTASLTQSEADLLYLKFPVAQGSEDLAAINVGGIATFDNNMVMNGVGNYLQFPDGTQQTTAGGGGALLSSNNNWTGTNQFQNSTTLNGLNLYNTFNANTISLTSSTSTNNTLNVSGAVSTLNNITTTGGSLIGINSFLSGRQETPYTIFTTAQTYPDLVNTTYGASKGYVNGLLGGTNSWTGTNSFNTNTTGITQLSTDNTTKLATTAFVQSVVGGGTNLLTANNSWSGTNAYNISIPTTSITQSYPQTTSLTSFSTLNYVNSVNPFVKTNYSNLFPTTSGGNSVWQGNIPSGIPSGFPNIIYLYLFTTNQSTAQNYTTAPPANVSLNNTSFTAYAIGTRQNYNTATISGQVGYVFSVISVNGIPSGTTLSIVTPVSNTSTSSSVGVQFNISLNDGGAYSSAGTALQYYYTRFTAVING